jgi:putative ABC transport system permease protein
MIQTQTMERMIYHSFTGLRYSAWMMLLVSLMALALAMVGIYAVISYVVSERTHEIGIRVALGATARQVRSSILGRSMALVGAGTLVGLAGAVAMANMLTYFLFGVTAGDIAPYAGVTVAFLVTGLAASWLPARRAMRVDPVIALRNL